MYIPKYNLFSFNNVIYICFQGLMYMCMCLLELRGPCTCKYLQRSEAIRFPRIRAIGYCELLTQHRSWELNLGPFKDSKFLNS